MLFAKKLTYLALYKLVLFFLFFSSLIRPLAKICAFPTEYMINRMTNINTQMKGQNVPPIPGLRDFLSLNP